MLQFISPNFDHLGRGLAECVIGIAEARGRILLYLETDAWDIVQKYTNGPQEFQYLQHCCASLSYFPLYIMMELASGVC